MNSHTGAGRGFGTACSGLRAGYLVLKMSSSFNCSAAGGAAPAEWLGGNFPNSSLDLGKSVPLSERLSCASAVLR